MFKSDKNIAHAISELCAYRGPSLNDIPRYPYMGGWQYERINLPGYNPGILHIQAHLPLPLANPKSKGG